MPITNLERGPSSEGAPSMHESSLNNSPQSYYTGVVERLRERVTHFYDGGKSAVSCDPEPIKLEAATIISELQSDRDALKHDIERHLGIIAELEKERERLTRERDNAYTMSRLQTARRIAAESSLSRIKSETVEACAKVAENYDPFGILGSVGNNIAFAIRSLSTDDSEKTAESKHSPSTQNTRTE